MPPEARTTISATSPSTFTKPAATAVTGAAAEARSAPIVLCCAAPPVQVLTVMVEGTHKVTHARTHGCLHLIDLAGSERVGKSGAEGQQLLEAQHINKSLRWVAECCCQGLAAAVCLLRGPPGAGLPATAEDGEFAQLSIHLEQYAGCLASLGGLCARGRALQRGSAGHTRSATTVQTSDASQHQRRMQLLLAG